MLKGAVINEIAKLYHKKRLHVVVGIILFFALMMMLINKFDKEETVKDWRTPAQAQVQEMNTYISTLDKQSKDYKDILNHRNKLEYQLDHNVNPNVAGAAGAAISSVSGMFIKIILPILIVIVTADIIAGEASNGTLKTLLVSPMGRVNILFSKWIAATFVSIGAMLFSDLLTYLCSIPFYGLGNWNDMIVIGTDSFRSIPIWEYMLIGLLLNTVMIIALTSVFMLVSVLFQTVATSISLSICLVVFGGILANFQEKLSALKYLFILNLDLCAHLIGEFDLKGTSLIFSSIVLVVTVIVTLSVSYTIFTKKDLLV